MMYFFACDCSTNVTFCYYKDLDDSPYISVGVSLLGETHNEVYPGRISDFLVESVISVSPRRFY